MDPRLRFICLLILIIAQVRSAYSQNLIPNGDFEFFTSCPTTSSQLDLAFPWFEPSNLGGASDYYNSCSSGMSVPNNSLGFQAAHSGNGYSGIYLYFDLITNSREYLEVQITEELVAGQCYQLTMFVNLGNNCRYTTDAIGVYFADTATTSLPYPGIMNVTPQLVNVAGNMLDSASWTLISGTYTAVGGENFIVIGNFFPDVSTTITNVNPSGIQFSYCFVDDVTLTSCTGIGESLLSGNVTIFPNPFTTEIKIVVEQNLQNAVLSIYNSLGREVFRIGNISGREIRIQNENLSNGVYYARLIQENKTILVEKLLVSDRGE